MVPFLFFFLPYSLNPASLCVRDFRLLHSWTTVVTTVILMSISPLRAQYCTASIQTLSWSVSP